MSATTPLSTPYWTPRTDAARYDFEPDVPFGVPFRPTPFRATFALSIAGADVTVERPVEYRYSDLVAGEKRMELQVVPPFAVRDVARHRRDSSRRRHDRRGIGRPLRTRNDRRSRSPTIRKGPSRPPPRCSLPAGWRAAPASIRGRRSSARTKQVTVTFAVTPRGGCPSRRIRRREHRDGPWRRHVEYGLRSRRIPAHPPPARRPAGARARESHRRHDRARPAGRLHHGRRRRDAGRDRAARRRGPLDRARTSWRRATCRRTTSS